MKLFHKSMKFQNFRILEDLKVFITVKHHQSNFETKNKQTFLSLNSLKNSRFPKNKKTKRKKKLQISTPIEDQHTSRNRGGRFVSRITSPLKGLMRNATTFCAELRRAISKLIIINFKIAQRNRSAELSSKCRSVSY